MKNITILVIGGLLLLVGLNSCFETCEENRRNLHTNENFNGIIDSIYLDKSRKNQPFVRVNGTSYIIINAIYKQFSKGDTLFKRSGSMKYYWVKNGDTTVFYQMCGNREMDAVRD